MPYSLSRLSLTLFIKFALSHTRIGVVESRLKYIFHMGNVNMHSGLS